MLIITMIRKIQKPITIVQRTVFYRLCGCASGVLIAVIWNCAMLIRHLLLRDCEKKSVNKILLWYARVASLKIRLLTLVLYITVVEWHVKSRRFSARLIRLFIRYSGRRPSYIILSSPYTCAQLRIVLVHFFVASNVARYSAFNRAVSLGNTLLWRFSFR